jgi:hypothetical protein
MLTIMPWAVCVVGAAEIGSLGTVISADPSKAVPLIFLVAASFVAVAALPVQEPDDPETLV